MSEKDFNKTENSFLSMCHDLKAPLQNMLGVNTVNQNKLTKEIIPSLNTTNQELFHVIQQVEQNVKIISREGSRLSEMIENILDMYCLEQDKIRYRLKSYSVPKLMEEISSLMKTACEAKNLHWKVTYEKTLSFALLDRHWILRLIENLISNAVKFTEKGSITCHATPLEHEVKFVMADTGSGIPQHLRNHIFEKYTKFPTKGEPRGSGLGLAICCHIIEGHGGRIWAESREGEGTTFNFTVPAV